MKNKFIFSTLLILPLFFAVPHIASAELTQYTLLEPLPLRSGGAPTDTVDTSNYIASLFRLALAVAGALAVFRLIYAGFLYMSSDAFYKKNEAKTVISQALWGLGLTMGAWLIVALILEPEGNAFTFNLSFDKTPLPEFKNPPTGGDGGGGPGQPGPGASSLTQDQVIAQFGSQIEVVGPIVLTGIQQTTIDELLRLKQQCGSNCAVMVTSATGGSHNEGVYSHANGYKVDLRNTGAGATLTNFILKNYPYTSTRSDGAKQYRAPSGAIYALESNHWDVLVK